MLPVENRLRKTKEFQVVYRAGKVVRGKYLTARYLKNNCHKKTRFGFTPARKIKNMVLKNKTKRRLRALCRKYHDYFLNHCDVVVNIHRDAVNASYQELESDFLKIFQKARLISKGKIN